MKAAACRGARSTRMCRKPGTERRRTHGGEVQEADQGRGRDRTGVQQRREAKGWVKAGSGDKI